MVSPVLQDLPRSTWDKTSSTVSSMDTVKAPASPLTSCITPMVIMQKALPFTCTAQSNTHTHARHTPTDSAFSHQSQSVSSRGHHPQSLYNCHFQFPSCQLLFLWSLHSMSFFFPQWQPRNLSCSFFIIIFSGSFFVFVFVLARLWDWSQSSSLSSVSDLYYRQPSGVPKFQILYTHLSLQCLTSVQ